MAAFPSWLRRHSPTANLIRIVHPGGHVELHDRPLRAAEIILRNPRCCVTQQPAAASQPSWEIVTPETMMRLGRKYYLVPESSIRKLRGRRTPAAEEENRRMNCGGCFNGGNCVMSLVERMKMRKENEKVRRWEEERVKRRRFASCDSWQPSLESINEECNV